MKMDSKIGLNIKVIKILFSNTYSRLTSQTFIFLLYAGVTISKMCVFVSVCVI